MHNAHAHHTPASSPRASQRGFTLIDAILGIVLAGVLGVFVVQFMNVTLPRSHKPQDWVHQEADVGTALENITASYVQTVNSNTITSNWLDTFYTSIATGGDPAVGKSKVCFKSDGTLAPAGTCPSNTVDMIRVDVNATDGRRYTTMFAMTRNATDPTRTH